MKEEETKKLNTS